MVTAKELYSRTVTDLYNQRIKPTATTRAAQEDYARKIKAVELTKDIQSKKDELSSRIKGLLDQGYTKVETSSGFRIDAPRKTFREFKKDYSSYVPHVIYTDKLGNITEEVRRSIGGGKMKRAYDSSRVAYKDNIKSREEAYTMVGKSSVKRTSVMEYTNGVGTRTYKRDMSKYKDRGTPRDYTESDTYKKFNPEQKAAYKKAQMKKGIYTPAQLKKAGVLTPSAQMKEYGAVLVGGTATRLQMEAKSRGLTTKQVRTLYSMTPKSSERNFGALGGMTQGTYKEYKTQQEKGIPLNLPYYTQKKEVGKENIIAVTRVSPEVEKRFAEAIAKEKAKAYLWSIKPLEDKPISVFYKKPTKIGQGNIMTYRIGDEKPKGDDWTLAGTHKPKYPSWTTTPLISLGIASKLQKAESFMAVNTIQYQYYRKQGDSKETAKLKARGYKTPSAEDIRKTFTAKSFGQTVARAWRGVTLQTPLRKAITTILPDVDWEYATRKIGRAIPNKITLLVKPTPNAEPLLRVSTKIAKEGVKQTVSAVGGLYDWGREKPEQLWQYYAAGQTIRGATAGIKLGTTNLGYKLATKLGKQVVPKTYTGGLKVAKVAFGAGMLGLFGYGTYKEVKKQEEEYGRYAWGRVIGKEVGQLAVLGLGYRSEGGKQLAKGFERELPTGWVQQRPTEVKFQDSFSYDDYSYKLKSPLQTTSGVRYKSVAKGYGTTQSYKLKDVPYKTSVTSIGGKKGISSLRVSIKKPATKFFKGLGIGQARAGYVKGTELKKGVQVFATSIGKKQYSTLKYVTPKGKTYFIRGVTAPKGKVLTKIYRWDVLLQTTKQPAGAELIFGEQLKLSKQRLKKIEVAGEIPYYLETKKQVGIQRGIALVAKKKGKLHPVGIQRTERTIGLEAITKRKGLVKQYEGYLYQQGQYPQPILKRGGYTEHYFQFVKSGAKPKPFKYDTMGIKTQTTRPLVTQTLQKYPMKSEGIIRYIHPTIKKIPKTKIATGRTKLTPTEKMIMKKWDAMAKKDALKETKRLITLANKQAKSGVAFRKRMKVIKSERPIEAGALRRMVGEQQMFSKEINSFRYIESVTPQMLHTQFVSPLKPQASTVVKIAQFAPQTLPPSVVQDPLAGLIIKTRGLLLPIPSVKPQLAITPQLQVVPQAIALGSSIIQQQRPITKVEPIIIQQQRQQQKQEQVQQQVQIQQQIQPQLQVQPQRTIVPIIEPVPPIIPPPDIPLPERKSEDRGLINLEVQGYDVMVKRKQQKLGKGKYKSLGYKKANKRPLTRKAALGLGMSITDTYTNRSFSIKATSKAGVKDTSLVSKYNALKNKFRQSKQSDKIFVEKTTHAIDSLQEKKGIPYESAKVRKRMAELVSNIKEKRSVPTNLDRIQKIALATATRQQIVYGSGSSSLVNPKIKPADIDINSPTPRQDAIRLMAALKKKGIKAEVKSKLIKDIRRKIYEVGSVSFSPLDKQKRAGSKVISGIRYTTPTKEVIALSGTAAEPTKDYRYKKDMKRLELIGERLKGKSRKEYQMLLGELQKEKRRRLFLYSTQKANIARARDVLISNGIKIKKSSSKKYKSSRNLFKVKKTKGGVKYL